MRSKVRRQWLLLLAGAMLGACASSPPPPPRPAEPVTLAVTVVAQADTNPDLRGRPSPIAVRVFELRSRAAFEAADFFSLYERDQATLASELVAREQFVMKPGESQSFTRKAGAETRHIAVLAAFRDLERSTWRAFAAVAPPVEPGRAGSPPRQQSMRIVIERAAVRIESSGAS